MRKIFLSPMLFAIILTAVVSCTKHQDDVRENIPLHTINFTSPTLTATYRSADSIAIRATAISTATIHGYDIIVRKLNDTTKLYFKNVHDHNDTLSINQKWKNNITTQTNMEAEIVLYLDHEGHTGSKKASFRIQ
jgi:hypothetical protein